ncbi:hypothetical protein NPIL_32841 [Nephila pilipes]|uniref:Uncharacterized protein n=1 Tax=Nephila pilipes TaxID=299642 RepID=A0A8X6N9N9_NEPPI|nr:hypothetical protein NPIL_32841 [Nephila pilipes]
MDVLHLVPVSRDRGFKNQSAEAGGKKGFLPICTCPTTANEQLIILRFWNLFPSLSGNETDFFFYSALAS